MRFHSLAFRRPANLAIFAVPRQPGVMSQLISGMPHRERLVATTKSPTRGQLQATAGSHAVNSGDRHGYQVVDHRDGLLIHPDVPNEIRWLPVVELLHVISGAQNVSPAPRRITMRQPRSTEISLTAALSSANTSRSSALRHSGRFNAIVVTGPRALLIL
jgi:hypothetical protein